MEKKDGICLICGNPTPNYSPLSRLRKQKRVTCSKECLKVYRFRESGARYKSFKRKLVINLKN